MEIRFIMDVAEAKALAEKKEVFERPKIGVALAVRRDGKVLIHKRRGPHAPGVWAFAGGHLEMWEELADAALRELREEAGPEIKCTLPQFLTVCNTRYYDEGSHYLTVIMVADWISGEAQVMEPEKCECWEWHDWDSLPRPLMMGLQQLVDRGMRP